MQFAKKKIYSFPGLGTSLLFLTSFLTSISVGGKSGLPCLDLRGKAVTFLPLSMMLVVDL